GDRRRTREGAAGERLRLPAGNAGDGVVGARGVGLRGDGGGVVAAAGRRHGDGCLGDAVERVVERDAGDRVLAVEDLRGHGDGVGRQRDRRRDRGDDGRREVRGHAGAGGVERVDVRGGGDAHAAVLEAFHGEAGGA